MQIIDGLIKKGLINRKNIKTDSRDVGAGDVFVAIKGTSHDGHLYIKEVLDKGAMMVICQSEPGGLSGEQAKKVICVRDTRKLLGELARSVYGDPAESMKIHGVTGTNGKTTTVFLINSILASSGHKSGFISTVFINTSGSDLEKAVMTTPDVLTINSALDSMRNNGKKTAVLEVSSHALSQERIWGIGLDSAVFTNITPEHMDYHRNMGSYLEDKARIFSYLKPGGLAVVNADDPLVFECARGMDLSRMVTFGIKKDSDIQALDIETSIDGSRFKMRTRDFGQTSISTGLIGTHNIYNILSSASVLLYAGLPLDDIRSGIASFPGVPGRLELVDADAPFKVFVDYAHTPNALENVLAALKGLVKGRLICVFGCGGDRDRAKRPEMGRIAAANCDRVIVTSDNPRSEEPENIISEIKKGMSEYNNYSIINNREEAIKAAINIASAGDVILIAGKGHEDYQVIGNEKLHFDDRDTAKRFL